VPATRAVNAGELLTLADLNPDECFPEPPTVNGTPAAFFLCLSSLLNFITMFDFTPNAPPDPNGAAFETRPMRYPLTEIARAEQMLLAMRPIEKYKQLADASWPPGPGHYPSVLWQMHRDPRIMEQADFAEIVAASYSAAYWKRQMAFWTETNFFGDRLSYVKKAIDEYLVGDYLSSIYVVVPHFRVHR